LLFCNFVCVCPGGLPGPVLFGFVIDRSCLLWETKCDGSSGACLYYDTHQMAWLLMAVCVACKVFNIVCGFISWRLYERKYGKEHSAPPTAVEYMLSITQTGNGQTGNSYGSTENIVEEVRVSEEGEALATTNPALDEENRNAHS